MAHRKSPTGLWLRISLLTLALIILLVAAPPCLAQPASAPNRLEQMGAATMAPEYLPKVLGEGAATLQSRIKTLQTSLADSQSELTQTQKDLKDLQIAVASLRAALSVAKPALVRVQELLVTYTTLDTQAKNRLTALAAAADALRREIATETVAQNTLRNQVSILQAAGLPVASSPEMQQALSTYLKLADSRDRLAAQVWSNQDQTRQLLGQEREILGAVLPDLKKMEETWKTELLKRPPSRLSLREQLTRLLANMVAVPGKAWGWLAAFAASGALLGFFLGHLTHFIGLLVFLALLSWSTKRLRRLSARRFKEWRARKAHQELLPLYVLGKAGVQSLFRLGLICWVSLISWDFGALGSRPADFVLYLLGAWWALGLALNIVGAFFAGDAAGGVLPLGKATARFYRRSLKFFAVYLILGIFCLKSAPLLNFPESSRIFAEHVFLGGFMIWALWLLRQPYLTRLQPKLPDPAWVRRRAVARVLKGIILFLLLVTILANLLGLFNLAVYVAAATAWSGLSILLFWFMWLAGQTFIFHLLHPETGLARRRFEARQEMLRKIYLFFRLVLSVILGAAVIFWALDFWGIPPDRVAWAFRWLTWGPNLGPVKLNLLNVGAAALALYLGFWISRLLRSFMGFRIFPHTGFDSGVQYTISTTVHYVVLILAALVALSLLGFPLTSLALVAGALGVGVGFGLQNIVNNFISGLILLFERPIKVGDLLVIDGQWGTVKEIRVRSTVFETSDRSVLIIPNSQLISGQVLNWTHYGQGINRITLKVGVSYDSDVRQVTQLLTDICRGNHRVVDNPPPQIFFNAYGDSALDFTIWVHVKTPNDRIPATHELNSAILETFKEQGIEIPFPQRDLHLKDWPGPPAA